jgi:hypothetical protein
VEVSNNQFEKVVSDVTGAFDFNIDNIKVFKSSNNEYRNITGQTGSLYYLSGVPGAKINQFILYRDTLVNSGAKKNGGGIYLNQVDVDTLEIDRLKLTSLTAAESGGFITGYDGINIGYLKQTNCEIEKCSAGLNGGYMAFTGKSGTFYIYLNKFTDNKADQNGGSFYLVSTKEKSKSLYVKSDFENKDVTGTIISGEGGAFYIRNWQHIEFDKSLLHRIKSKRSGGGINAGGIDTLHIYKSEFVFNESKENNGGALELQNIGLFISDKNWYNSNLAHKGKGGFLHLSSGNLSMNLDSVLYNESFTGAGIYLEGVDGIIDSTYFIENKVYDTKNTGSQGGAVYLGLPSKNGVLFSDCSFYRNRAFQGGGIFMRDAKATFIRNKFAFNLANRNGAGCMLEDSPASSFLNCLFKGNEVNEPKSENGTQFLPIGGIYLYFSGNTKGITRIINNVFHGNDGMAVGIAPSSVVSDSAHCFMANSILYFNKYFDLTNYQYYVPGDKRKLLKIENCCIQDNDLNYCPTCINKNPMFNLPDSYCLQVGSPCINTGIDNPLYYDIDPWKENGIRNDMGVTGGPYAFLDCTSTSIKDDYLIVENVGSDIIASMLNVYPNPSMGVVFVSSSKKYSGNFSIEVISSTGILVMKNSYKQGILPLEIRLELGHLTKGVYLLRIGNNQEKDSRKIVIM